MFHILISIEENEKIPKNLSQIKTNKNNEIDKEICQIECGIDEKEIKGQIHFFRRILNKEENKKKDKIQPSSNVLLVLLIPTTYFISDFINFLSYNSVHPKYIRFLRDGSKFLSLIGFDTIEKSQNAYERLNCTEYRECPSIFCHVVYVESIEFVNKKMDNPFNIDNDLTEIPTCTICLERLDDSISGITITSCNHEFHSKCLQKYFHNECPLCRHFEGNEIIDNECDECSFTKNLWMCIICGHIGCGRTHKLHAEEHFVNSGHCYAMELDTQAVWDYVQNQYVHRLILDQKDGQVVEFPGDDDGDSNNTTSDTNPPTCKSQIRYEYESLIKVLSETQKHHYVSEMDKQKQNYEKILNDNNLIIQELQSKNSELIKKLSESNKKNQNLEKNLKKVNDDVNFYKDINDSISKDKEKYDKLINDKDKTIKDLQNEIKSLEECINDLTKNIDVQNELLSRKDIDGGSAVIIPKSISKKKKKK